MQSKYNISIVQDEVDCNIFKERLSVQKKECLISAQGTRSKTSTDNAIEIHQNHDRAHKSLHGRSA